MPQRERRQLALFIPLALVAAGLAAGTAQVLVFRELLVACQGNEISMALMLAAWLLWGALGAWWAGARRPAVSIGRACSKLAHLAAWPALSLLLAIATVRLFGPLLTYVTPPLAQPPGGVASGLLNLFTLVPGEMLSVPQIILLAFLGTMLPALLAGAQFAAGCRAYLSLRPQSSETVGRAYALDAVGHLLGGTLLAWLALQYVAPVLMALLVGFANLALGLLIGAVAVRAAAARRLPQRARLLLL